MSVPMSTKSWCLLAPGNKLPEKEQVESRASPSTATKPLLSACCIVLGKSDDLGLKKNIRLLHHIFNYLG